MKLLPPRPLLLSTWQIVTSNVFTSASSTSSNVVLGHQLFFFAFFSWIIGWLTNHISMSVKVQSCREIGVLTFLLSFVISVAHYSKLVKGSDWILQEAKTFNWYNLRNVKSIEIQNGNKLFSVLFFSLFKRKVFWDRGL